MVNEKIRRLIDSFKSRNLDLEVFALVKQASIDNWTVIASSIWLENMGEVNAIDFITRSLGDILSPQELNTIGRVSILKNNDPIISDIKKLNFQSTMIHLRNFYLGSTLINEAIFFEAKSIDNVTSMGDINYRNPRYNTTLNPRYNTTINPRYNTTLNPRYNTTINPRYNPNFNGLSLYNLNLDRVSYVINANNNFSLIFDLQETPVGYFVRANERVLIRFSNDDEWEGYAVYNNHNGFNYFDLNNEWAGIIL